MLLDSSQSSHIGSNIFKHTVYVGLLLMEALIQMVFCWFLLFVLTACTTLKYDEIWWNIRKLAEGCRNCITRPPGFCPSPGCLSWFATCIPFPNEQIQWFMLQGFQVRYGGYYTYSISISIFILHILYISHTHTYIYIYTYIRCWGKKEPRAQVLAAKSRLLHCAAWPGRILLPPRWAMALHLASG